MNLHSFEMIIQDSSTSNFYFVIDYNNKRSQFRNYIQITLIQGSSVGKELIQKISVTIEVRTEESSKHLKLNILFRRDRITKT